MFVAICVLIIIASILLVLVVLVQNSKGGGLAANFASGNQTFGVRQTADYLEKATWTLAIVILVFCMVGSVASPRGGTTAKSSVQQQLQNTQSTGNTMNFPVQQGQPQEQSGTQEEQPQQPQN